MKERIKRVPVLGPMLAHAYRKLYAVAKACRKPFARRIDPFTGSADYWERRYGQGGDSGVGSYGKFAAFKAEVLNEFVHRNHVQTVIELGCGDGNQLELARYPGYIGFDVSPTAIAQCRERFARDPSKSFHLMSEFAGHEVDLALSLDVIYHLVEDAVFEQYMQALFSASTRYVIVYASDREDPERRDGAHVRHRRFTTWVNDHLPQWRLVKVVPNRYPYRGDYREGSFADFHVYATGASTPVV